MEKALRIWLEERGYSCFRNISIGGKFPDVLAVKNNTITTIEIKKRAFEITNAIGQCIHYLQKANMVYIAFPSKEIDLIPSETKETLKTYNIGLVTGIPTVNIIIESKKTPKNNSSLIKKLDEIRQGKVKPPFSLEGNYIRERIINLLKEHPEGLTILDISKHIGISRQTASRYVYGLISEVIVEIRKIGPAKLCYLKRGKKSGRK